MTLMTTERLLIRNWRNEDRDLFRRINADDRVMEFFSFRRDRAASDRLMNQLREEIETRGFGLAALEIRESGECIGFTGLHETAGIPSLPLGTVEIGWRLAPEYWGKGFVTEAAKAWLDHGFEKAGLEEIVSFAVWSNARSIAVMERLGMTAAPERDFDHPLVPDTHPHLKPHVFYRITRDEWQNRNRAAAPGGAG